MILDGVKQLASVSQLPFIVRIGFSLSICWFLYADTISGAQESGQAQLQEQQLLLAQVTVSSNQTLNCTPIRTDEGSANQFGSQKLQ